MCCSCRNKQIILLQIKFVLYPKLAWAQEFLEKWQLKGNVNYEIAIKCIKLD